MQFGSITYKIVDSITSGLEMTYKIFVAIMPILVFGIFLVVFHII